MNEGNKSVYSNTTAKVRRIFQLLLGVFLLLAGISHLTWSRVEFLAQVPKWLPLNGNFVVILSGITEILLGGALIFLTNQRVKVGWIVAVFFVLIFPGNISQYLNGIDAFGLETDNARFIRLFFQPVLVFWALWSTGAFKACMGAKNQNLNK
ncbi:MAG: hypothetical protein CVV23_11110 [Ignavibacteriae bacterium HGW-Ignavibacteriae-2]|jgi:uncharacterized membrane protein|nr:MAG: hypothetical protein CVV23_11110 [Ignavibacteriae bacterium HGW-Ignavibacteriae-2]